MRRPGRRRRHPRRRRRPGNNPPRNAVTAAVRGGTRETVPQTALAAGERLAHVAPGKGQHQAGQNELHPEDRLPAKCLVQDAAECGGADHRHDRHAHGHIAQHGRRLVRRMNVADCGAADGHAANDHRLTHAKCQKDLNVRGGEDTAYGGQEEQHEAPQDHRTTAEPVRDRTNDDLQQPVHCQVKRDRKLHDAVVHREMAGHGGQGGQEHVH